MAVETASKAGAIVSPCPYLRTRGGIAAARPSRDQRCEAAGKAGAGIPVHRDTQALVCLQAAYRECEAYVEAQSVPGRRRDGEPSTGRRIGSTRIVVVVGPPAVDRPSHPIAPSTPIGDVLPRSRTGGRRRTAIVACLVAAVALVAIFALAPQLPFNVASATHRPTVSGPSHDAGVSTPSAVTPNPTPPAESSSPGEPTPSAESSSPAATPSPTAPGASTMPAPSPSPRTYVIQPGDTLGAIAAKFGTTAAAIAAANGMDQDATIYAGQKLIIPW